MKKILILILFLFSFMLIAGCSSEDCSLKDTTYEKFTYNDVKGECVSMKITQDECGNGVAEESDGGFCGCPKDIPKTHPTWGCTGTIGEYLEKSCSVGKECVLKQNDKVVEETKAIQLKNSDIILDGLFTLKNPFILNTFDKNKLIIDLTFLKITSPSKKVKNMVIKEIRLEGASAKILGSATYNENLVNVGDKLSRKQITISDTDKYQTTETIKVSLIVSYTLELYDTSGRLSKTEDKIETLVGSLGRVDIINPNFEVNVK